MTSTPVAPRVSVVTPVAPRVSVVTPAFNAARFIEQTIRSVQAQTIEDWELIVVDDGSRDGTPALVACLAEADSRIRLLSSGGNRGPARARNRGIEQARAPYLAFLDSDDLWLTTKLERQLAFMSERRAAFSFTSYSVIDEEGHPLGSPVLAPARVGYKDLLRNTIIGCLTVMLDLRLIDPPRMLDLPQHEDLTLWYQILKKGATALGMPEVLARYRVVGGSASRNKVRSAQHMWQVYRRVERLSLPQSAWYYAHYAWNAFRKNRI
jgi:teichuronic acid biosynthesis glycosyltransferase TuaG